MKYTWEEYLKLREQHKKDFECLEYIDSAQHEKCLETILNLFKNTEDAKVVTLTRPVITLNTFKLDYEFYNYLVNTVHLNSFGYWPEIGYFAFFRNQEDLLKFTTSDERLQNGIISNFKHADVFEKCAELIRYDDTKTTVWFDEIEFKK